MLGMLLDSVLGAGGAGSVPFAITATGIPNDISIAAVRSRGRVGGHAWLTNDAVNALATGAAALLGWAAWAWWNGQTG